MLSSTATAQILPDTSLPNNSQVINQGTTSNISGGTVASKNLFHSFEKFSLPTGGTAYFNNDLNIENIIGRVTGSSISNIDGLLKANGTANLFLINPKGIIFGSNARLDIGGSFVGSTANSINFPDGSRFSATNPEIKPLISINVPMGLQYGSNPGAIKVEGKGSNLTIPVPLFSPIFGAGTSTNGLQVASAKTLALIGGKVSLKGGILTAPGGRIELGSVSDGVVILNPTATGWILGYQDVQNFQDIKLSQQALADTSGFGGSSIAIAGREVSFVGGSLALIQNQGTQPGGNINVNAFDSLNLSGTSSDANITSGLINETVAGSPGNILVSTKHLVVDDGAAISAKTFTEANSGNIILSASESTKIAGFSSVKPTVITASGIGNYTFSSGNGGDIIINTEQFTGLDGGTVLAGTFGNGKGGNLTVNASKGIQLSGFNPFVSLSPSQLAVGAFSTGDTGTLKINTPKISLQNGGNINSYTFGTGNAGNIIINAPNSIEIINDSSNGLLYNQVFGISSDATVTASSTQELLKLRGTLSGSAGNLIINTGRLTITNNGIINVSNFGNGNAGDVTINANDIYLNNNSIIAAASKSGQGGNIFLQTHLLRLHHSSVINATASDPGLASISNDKATAGTGNGGNIIINANIVSASEKSSITANAVAGRGGNITINAKGVFFSPDSFVTASSKYGINGTITYNITGGNIVPTQPKAEVIPTDPKMTSVCPNVSGAAGSNFVVSDTGNLKSNPNDLIRNNVKQSTLVPNQPINNSQTPKSSISKQPTEIIEANAWIRDSQGNLVLTIDQVNLASSDTPLSASSCFSKSQ